MRTAALLQVAAQLGFMGVPTVANARGTTSKGSSAVVQAAAQSSFQSGPARRGAAPVVVVYDTGFAVRHPDLAPSLWRNPREARVDGRDDDPITLWPAIPDD